MTDRVVWKFPLTNDDGQVLNDGVVSLPEGAVIRHVGAPKGGAWYLPVSLWAEVDPKAPVVDRQFGIYATGTTIDPGMAYVGTFFIATTVWHVYERETQ